MITIQIDELTKEEFDFYLSGLTLYLNTYKLLKRESKKNSYKKVKWYDRLNKRDCTMTEDQVPLTQHVRDLVISQAASQLCCKKWSEK